MKKLIIAEKPSVMRDFVKVLEPSAKSNCYAKPYVYYYEGKNYIFASANGHLFQLKEPEEIHADNAKWTTNKLNLPDLIPLKPIKSSHSYFKCIQELSKRNDIDEIIVATDPDREGQLIWTLIERNLKVKKNIEITRVMIKEWTDTGLAKAFHNRKPNKTYKSLEDAGVCRMQSDYIIGMTGTRVNTVSFGGYKNVINEGRVQSATRYLVADLENTIKNFKPEDYSLLTLETSSNEKNPLILSSDKLELCDAETLNKQLNMDKPQFTINKEVTEVKKKCPMLYKTNDILREASSQLSLSIDKTTDILQSLYQKGLTTYPRTEINQISMSASKDVMKIVNSLEGIGYIDDYVKEIKSKKFTFQKHLINTGGGDMPHEAITPTYDGNPKTLLKSLTKDELNVYLLIARRFLQGFYPPAIIEETKIDTTYTHLKKDYTFKASGKTILDGSWMKLGGIPKDTLLPKVTDGKKYEYKNSKVEKKQTLPPVRFTMNTLLNAMENAGRYVDDKDAKKVLKEIRGIGTGATRSDIINGLFKSGFLTKKGQTIFPTEKCMQWMEVTPDSPLKSPMMTAQLETDLGLVETGKLSFNDFMKIVDKQLNELIESAKKSPKGTITNNKKASISGAEKTSNKPENSDLGICPFCGKPMKENDKSYYCPGYREGCQFSIWKEISGKKITKAAAKQIIKNGKTKTIKGFVSKKTGKTFEAKLILDKSTRQIKFDFS